MAKFTQDPSPVTPGEACTVCYDFSGTGGIQSTTATLDWDPTGLTPASLEFQNQDGKRCVTFTVPANCQGCVVKDNSGFANDFALDLT